MISSMSVKVIMKRIRSYLN